MSFWTFVFNELSLRSGGERQRRRTARARVRETTGAIAKQPKHRSDRRGAMHGQAFSTAKAKALWRDARELERVVEKALGPGTSFMEWLLLETIDELNEVDPENTSQAAIADRAGAHRKAVSYWMQELTEVGLVDRGEHADRRCWSVLLSAEGQQKLAWCRQQLEGALRNR